MTKIVIAAIAVLSYVKKKKIRRGKGES